MALLAWLWVILPVVEMTFGNRPSQSSNNVPLWTLGTVPREILQSRGHTGCRWGSMRVSNLEMRPSWNDTPCDQCWEPLVTWFTRAGPTCQGQFQSYRAVSTAPHVCDIQEKNRAVRLPKAHKDLALPVSTIPVGHICFVSYGDASGGSTRAEEVQAVYVVLMAEQASLSHNPFFLEISPCQACCSHCLSSPKRLLKATGCVQYGVKWY